MRIQPLFSHLVQSQGSQKYISLMEASNNMNFQLSTFHRINFLRMGVDPEKMSK